MKFKPYIEVPHGPSYQYWAWDFMWKFNYAKNTIFLIFECKNTFSGHFQNNDNYPNF